MPVRGEEEPKDVQIDNLLKANKGLDGRLAEYRCLGTIEEIGELKAKAEAFCGGILSEETKMNQEKEKKSYLLLCHVRADAMLKGKLHEHKGLENELEAVDILIKRIKPTGELKSTQVIASIITKHIPWFRWF